MAGQAVGVQRLGAVQPRGDQLGQKVTSILIVATAQLIHTGNLHPETGHLPLQCHVQLGSRRTRKVALPLRTEEEEEAKHTDDTNKESVMPGLHRGHCADCYSSYWGSGMVTTSCVYKPSVRTHSQRSSKLNSCGSGGGGRQVTWDGDGIRRHAQILQHSRIIRLPTVHPVETQNLCMNHHSEYDTM